MSVMEKTRDIFSELLRLRSPLLVEAAGEFTGTMLLVLFSLGSSIQIAISGSNLDNYLLGSLAAGVGFTLAIYVTGQAGKGHLNPAITLGYGILGRINWRQFLVFNLAQYLGAFSAAVVLSSVYHEAIVTHTEGPGSSALFTNGSGLLFVTTPRFSHMNALFDQMLGAAILVGGIVAITDKNNWRIPKAVQPLIMGLQLTVVLMAFSYNAGGAINPARDFGPRCFLAMAGWTEAFWVDNYYFWIPIVGPYLGGILGTICYYLFIGNHLSPYEDDEDEKDEYDSLENMSD